MRLNATRLRGDLYKILDRVLETGEPAEIERRGRLLRITAMTTTAGLDQLVSRPERIAGDPDDLVGLGWADSWQPSPPAARARRSKTARAKK